MPRRHPWLGLLVLVAGCGYAPGVPSVPSEPDGHWCRHDLYRALHIIVSLREDTPWT